MVDATESEKTLTVIKPIGVVQFDTANSRLTWLFGSPPSTREGDVFVLVNGDPIMEITIGPHNKIEEPVSRRWLKDPEQHGLTPKPGNVAFFMVFPK